MVVLDQRKATQSNARDIKVHVLIHLAPGSSENKRLLNKKKKGITYWESIQLDHLLPGRNGVK